MKRRSSAFEKISSGKGFYITAAVAFCAIIVSVVVAYYTSDRVGQKTQQLDRAATTGFTEPVEANQTDIPDERDLETVPINNAEPTTQETTAAPTTTQPQTTAPATTQEAKIVNREFVLPSGGDVIRKFSPNEPVYSKTMEDWRTHNGVDFAVDEGEEVYSIGNGKVTKVISDIKWGYVIEIDYGDFTGRYCGIKQNTAVKIDETVKTGDVIGEIDVIPIEAEDGTHLHFEAIQNGKTVDPFQAMNAR
ncbi:MAG: M23 family metallopeptidase [Ruminococcus sp.]|nr:M23 family metallopeptidase [Ruminococcus sp.]